MAPDPLVNLPDVPPPAKPQAPIQHVGNKKIPNGCPGGSSPATTEAPATCQFPSNYKDTTWRLYPGTYPGGLKLLSGSFYFEPGIYWIGGDGRRISSNGSFIYSVEAGSDLPGGGVLFYNTATVGLPIGVMKLDGSSANMRLYPLKAHKPSWMSTWNGLLLYQDRGYEIGGDDLTINGSESVGMDVRGTIYVPRQERGAHAGRSPTRHLTRLCLAAATARRPHRWWCQRASANLPSRQGTNVRGPYDGLATYGTWVSVLPERYRHRPQRAGDQK